MDNHIWALLLRYGLPAVESAAAPKPIPVNVRPNASDRTKSEKEKDSVPASRLLTMK
jgi:hypothetical protein